MLSGQAAPEAHKPGAPTLDSVNPEAPTFDDVTMVQVMCETATSSVEELLPPALHPTVPGIINWLAYQCPSSPWGPFQLVQTRLECRSANRPRAFLVSAMIDNMVAGSALASGWGYRLHPAQIRFRRSYATTEIQIQQDDEDIFSLDLHEPSMLPLDAVQFVSGMHPALTANGYRLIQSDAKHRLTRSERAGSVSVEFAGAAWGVPTLEPQHIISAAICLGTLTLPQIRYVFRPAELGFGGGEPLSRSAG